MVGRLRSRNQYWRHQPVFWTLSGLSRPRWRWTLRHLRGELWWSNEAFEMTDAGALRDVGESAGIALTTGGRALLAIPIGDGPMDMFAGNENGANFLSKIKAMAPLKSVHRLWDCRCVTNRARCDNP